MRSKSEVPRSGGVTICLGPSVARAARLLALEDADDLGAEHLGRLIAPAEPQQGRVARVPLGHDRAQILVLRAHRHGRPGEGGATVTGDAFPDLVHWILFGL